jgi:hypothetical protein
MAKGKTPTMGKGGVLTVDKKRFTVLQNRLCKQSDKLNALGSLIEDSLDKLYEKYGELEEMHDATQDMMADLRH